MTPSLPPSDDTDDEVMRRLEDAGRIERESILAEANALVDYPGRARLEATLDSLAAPRPHRFLYVALAAAAATLLLAATWLVVHATKPRTTPPPYFVGNGAVELVEPLGPVEEYRTFRWNAELPAGGTFELRVWRSDRTVPQSPDLTVRDLETNSWTPDPSSGKPLPDAIRWEVRVVHPSGEVIESASGSASRLP